MTEAEWLVSEDPKPLLLYLSGKVSSRRLRLCMCGASRLNRLERRDGAIIAISHAIDLGERWADQGTVDPEELHTTMVGLFDEEQGRPTRVVMRLIETYSCISDDPLFLVHGRLSWSTRLLTLPMQVVTFPIQALSWLGGGWRKVSVPGAITSCRVIRCVFGNPFRPVTFSSEWRTSTAVALAKEMYESRDFSAMPILADALQDAGCDHADVLDHCRGTGPHVRGCWVVDMLLGKE